jgi:hypothetical protein
LKRLLFLLFIVPFFAKSQTHSWHDYVLTIYWPNSKIIKIRVAAFAGSSMDTVFILGFSEKKELLNPIEIGFDNKSSLKSFIQLVYDAEKKHDVHDDVSIETFTSTVDITWINDRLFIIAQKNATFREGSVELTHDDIQKLLMLQARY